MSCACPIPPRWQTPSPPSALFSLDQRPCLICSANAPAGAPQRLALSARSARKKNSCVRLRDRLPPPRLPSIVHDVIRSPGQPLDHSTRAFMEPRFGRDFSHVRIHADSSSSESASAISAQAYTVGRDIVFNTSNYSPQTTHGLCLIAHELAHVVQQTGATARPENGRSVQRTCRESLAQHSFRSADGMAQRLCPKPPTRLADTPLTFDKECRTSPSKVLPVRCSFSARTAMS